MPTKPNPRRANSHRRNTIRTRLLAQTNGEPTCALCGKPINPTIKTPHPMSLEIDEIIPVSKGGNPLDITNCQLTHRACNQTKGNKTGITHITQPHQTKTETKNSRKW
ncbi:HNH endonuclease [Alloscardovia macacae]|uniref:HNH endonuclease n=1 Tax=Alloscardovia macacae TaxID=1160091 RepID=UPI000B9A6860|nr:HNH endonuclease [Alloscardovia macacae]